MSAGHYLAHSAWHPADVEEWTYNGTAFQINSMYLLPEDAWTYELTGWYRTSGGGRGNPGYDTRRRSVHAGGRDPCLRGLH